MTVPQDIKVNLNAPFPSLVTGSGPIAIGKQNGIWTVGFTTTALNNRDPFPSQYSTMYLLGYDTTSQSFFNINLLSVNKWGRFCAGFARVNFNVGNADTAIPMYSPSPNYRIVNLLFANATASLTAANWGMFSATGGGGTAIFTAGQALTVTTGVPNSNNNLMMATPGTANTAFWNLTTLFFRVGTPQGAPATADVYVWVDPVTNF